MVEVEATGPKSFDKMEYSGRSVTAGMTEDGKPFVGYAISGRSPPSKARRLDSDIKDNRVVVETRATDEAVLKEGNVPLLLYPAIIVTGRQIVASNGRQTELVLNSSLPEALAKPVYVDDTDIATLYEPDKPHYTSRITVELKLQQESWVSVFHVVRKAKDSKDAVRAVYPYELKQGMAGIITTYDGSNQTPLLPFIGPPMEMEVQFRDAQGLCKHLFSMLRGTGPVDYRVATAAVTVAQSAHNEIEVNVSILNASDNTNEPHTSWFWLRQD